MKSFEFVLKYENDEWVCENPDFSFQSKELMDIDRLLKNKLSEYHPGETVEIALLFDFDSFPLWMRQYMPHYFNRKFKLNLTQN